MNQKDSKAVEEFRKKVRELLGNNLERLALFGSKAEGRDTWDSDIDILVLIKDSAANLHERILDLAFEINLIHDVYLSRRIITVSTYNHPVWRITAFMQTLRNKAISL